MSDVNKKAQSSLRQHDFRLIRDGRHLVYRNREGKIFVCSKTPSDHRASQNALTRLIQVIASPPRPEVVAISDFEREQAVLVIQGRGKTPAPGHGKQRHSGGTGIYWEEPEPITTEQEHIRQEQQERARKNEEERRARKLAKREERLAIEATQEKQREQRKQQRIQQREQQREQRELFREQNAWKNYALFLDHHMSSEITSEVMGWLREQAAQNIRKFTVSFDGTTAEEPGIFTYIKARTVDDMFQIESPEFQGWHSLIIVKYHYNGHDGIRYHQLHPLAVIRCGNEIVYAPWLNRNNNISRR